VHRITTPLLLKFEGAAGKEPLINFKPNADEQADTKEAASELNGSSREAMRPGGQTCSGRRRSSHGRGHWFDPSTAHHKSTTYEVRRPKVLQKYCKVGRELARHASTTLRTMTRDVGLIERHRDAGGGGTSRSMPRPAAYTSNSSVTTSRTSCNSDSRAVRRWDQTLAVRCFQSDNCCLHQTSVRPQWRGCRYRSAADRRLGMTSLQRRP
jgi:hypothetical protein